MTDNVVQFPPLAELRLRRMVFEALDRKCHGGVVFRFEDFVEEVLAELPLLRLDAERQRRRLVVRQVALDAFSEIEAYVDRLERLRSAYEALPDEAPRPDGR